MTALWQWLAWWPPDPEPEPVMTVARTVADVLTQHVTFEVECIDRMFLNAVEVELVDDPGGLHDPRIADPVRVACRIES